MKRLAWICLLFAWAAAAPSAAAQGSSSTLITFGGFGGPAPTSFTSLPVQTSGQLTISFHGDPGSGCATQGICGYSGTVIFTPGSQAQIALAKYRTHGRASYQVQLNLGGGPSSAFTAASATRVGGGLCGDAQQPTPTLSGTVSGGQVAIALLQPQGRLLATRCAGPLDADLAGLGPQIRLSLGQILHGRRTLPLGGGWSFAAGGFAGTVESSLTMTLGKPITGPTGSSSPPKGVKTRRDRELIEPLTLVGASGNLSLGLGSDPTTCQFLDSCGLQGSLDGTFAPPAETDGSLVVTGPANRPYRDFLAALGLSHRGNPRGLSVVGDVAWLGGGSATEHLQQGTSCTSSAPLPGGLVTFGTRGAELAATYSPIASPRTRCPGPELGQLQNLASGGVGRKALGQPTITVQLGGSGPLTDDGYTISQHTSLGLTLRRGRVRLRTFLEPTG